MTKKNYILTIILGGFICAGITMANAVFALNIEPIDEAGDANDFIVWPVKVELDVAPGQEVNQTISIVNRLGKQAEFEIIVEDFIGDEKDVTKFLGEGKSSFSCKDWFSPEVNKLQLDDKSKATLDVKIKVPEQVEPGDHYAAIFIKTKSNGEGAVSLASRIGSLFFLTVEGEQQKDGELKGFAISKRIFTDNHISFNLLFQNRGTIHLNPSGVVSIYNTFGKKIGEVIVDGWWILRGMSREKEIIFTNNELLGRYTAKIILDRGYDNLQDIKEVSFWIFNWPACKWIIAFFVILMAGLSWLVAWIVRYFKIKRKFSVKQRN